MANTRASDDHQISQLARNYKGLLLRICDGNMENTMEWVVQGEHDGVSGTVRTVRNVALLITF